MPSLRDHLTPGEQILAHRGEFYATTHRVVRYNQQTDDPEELPYVWLRSVELVREPNKGLMIKGTLAGILGLLTWAILGLWTALLLVVMGVVFIILGGQGREAYYQLNSDRLDKEEQKRWRIPFRGSMDFMVAVGEQSGKPLIDQ